jgi:circadian clock protein KaiB
VVKARVPVSRRPLRLRLYIAGDAPNSVRAVANLRAICDEHFAARHQIEVIDLLENPERGLTDGIIVTPTLLKLAPAPMQRMIGSLSDITQVVGTLNGK